MTKRRNQLGNIWDLQFFVSKQEKGKYDKQRTEFKKEKLAAKAAIKTETDAMTQVRWRVYLKSTYVASTSVRNVAAANFATVSNVMNTLPFASRSARCSSRPKKKNVRTTPKRRLSMA